MGWNTNDEVASTLSSYVPGDGTTRTGNGNGNGNGPSMMDVCDDEDKIGGRSFRRDNSQCVVTHGQWTQLTNGVPGDASSWYGDMSDVCEGKSGDSEDSGLGGYAFGEFGQFCAVEGYWSQLYSENDYDDRFEPYGLVKYCLDHGGTMFGENHFCALEGVYSQFTTKLPGETNPNAPSSMSSSMSRACDLIGGYSFDHYCIVKGEYTQLSAKLPGDAFHYDNLRPVCDELGGVTFGPNCAVEGSYTQLVAYLPGAPRSASTPNVTEVAAQCVEMDGLSYDHYCVVGGPYVQLTNRFTFGNANGVHTEPLVPPAAFMDACKGELKGYPFGEDSCAVPGNYTQLSSRLPYDNIYWETISNTCSKIGGRSIGNYGMTCVAEGHGDHDHGDKTPNTGVGGGIVALIIIIVFLVVVGVVVTCYLCRRKKQMYSAAATGTGTTPSFPVGAGGEQENLVNTV